VAKYLGKTRQSKPFDHYDCEDAEEAALERQSEIRRSAAVLLFVK